MTVNAPLSPEAFEDLIFAVTNGETVRGLFRDPDWIAKHGNHSRAALYVTLEADPENANRYARACSHRADDWAEQAITIAKDLTIAADHKRVMVDSVKWGAAKAKPKVYGDLQRLEIDADMRVTRDKAKTDAAVRAAQKADE